MHNLWVKTVSVPSGLLECILTPPPPARSPWLRCCVWLLLAAGSQRQLGP
jgi:hypothetical protein